MAIYKIPDQDSFVVHRTQPLASDETGMLKTEAQSSRNYVIEDDTAYENPVIHVYEIMWFLFGVLEMLLAFRFALKLFGANPFAGFSLFIYLLTDPFVSPFVGVLPFSVSGRVIIEWPVLVAMAAYFFLGFVIAELIRVTWPTRQNDLELDYPIKTPRLAL